PGTHVGTLWTNGTGTVPGAMLAQATFTGESASGWQTVNFSSPIAITAGTTYIASYASPAGRYVATPSYFSNAGVLNAPLRALQSGVDGPNGIFRNGRLGFPSESFAAPTSLLSPPLDRAP